MHRKHFYAQKLLHTDAFTHKSFYTQKLLHTDTFAHTQTLLHTRHFYTQTLLHTGAFTYRQFYTQTLLRTVAFTQTLLHTKLLPTEAFTDRSFYAQTLLHRRFYTDTFTHRRFYTQTLLTQTLLHTGAFTHRSVYTQTLLHTKAFTQKLLHIDAFTHKRFYAQTLLHTDALTHRHFYTQKLLHTDAFTRRRFYTQTLLHTEAFTHRRFYTQTLLHTDAFTQRSFYTQTRLHTDAFAHRKSQFASVLGDWASSHAKGSRLDKRNFTSVFGDRTSFRAKGLRGTAWTSQFYLSFWRSNLISCERVARDDLDVAILPRFLAIEPHFVRKGCAGQVGHRNFTFGDRTSFRAKGLRGTSWTSQFYLRFWRSNLISCERVAWDDLDIAILLQFLAIEPHFVRKGCAGRLGHRNFTAVFGDRTSFRAKGLRGTSWTSQFYFWRSNLISCERVARDDLDIAILPQFLAIEPHFVRKGCAGHFEIAILPQFFAIEPHFVRKGCVSCRLVGTAPAPAFRREIEKKEKARGQEDKRRRCEDVRARRQEARRQEEKMRRCEDEQMWRWADVEMWRCEDEKMWKQMWRCEAVKMSRCEDEKMWRCEDVKMWRCEDEKMWRWADVKMWRWADVKMRRCESRCEDVKLWRWADVKMRRCEDEKMWRWEDVKMIRCEDVRMWRCEDVKMWRWWEDVKMWRWEDEVQTPTIGRTLRSDALGKIDKHSKQSWKIKPHEIRMRISRSLGTGLTTCWSYLLSRSIKFTLQLLAMLSDCMTLGKMEHFWWRLAIYRWAETFCTQSASLQHDVSQHKPATAACCCTWLESVLNDNDSDIPIPSRMIVSQDSLGSFCTLVLGPYDMRPLLQPMLVVVEDSTFELRT